MNERRELAERTGSARVEQSLRAIVEGTASKTGEDFFRSLVRHLARALDVRYVLLGEVVQGGIERVRTRAVWTGEGFGEQFEYALADTPCAQVVSQDACLHRKGVQQLFPRDHLLAELGAESYLGTPLRDSCGRPLGLLAAIDVHPMEEDAHALDLLQIFASRAGVELERERAEEALRESERRGRMILDSTLDAVVTIDAEGRVTGWNARAREIFGWTSQEAIGRDLTQLIVPPEARASHRRGLAHFLATGEGPLLGRRVEVEALDRDGGRVPIDLSIATLRTGSSYEFSAFIQDIRERKQAERERSRLDARIRDAQHLESLGMLAGGIAHDFGNLLTGILAGAEAARRALGADHPASRHLAEVTQGSRLASRMTGQLLDYAGKGRVQSRPLDLSAEVSGLEALLRSSVRERACLALELASGLPPITADPVQVQQVLMNLVLNAAESDPERVRVVVRTGIVDLGAQELVQLVSGSSIGPGRHVFLEVEDDGCGLDEESQRRIFDPFFTTKTRGHGLGLAATLGIVHRHGGGIELRSRPGQGSRFRVLFPVSGEPLDTAPPPGPGDLAGRGLVLVVDDDEYVLHAVYTTLASYGYSVILAQSGEKALDFFRERGGEIDLVLLDQNMPGWSGDRTLDALQDVRPDVEVLLSTAHDPAETSRRFAGKRLSGCLRKPYDPDELAAVVKRLLGHGSELRPPETLDGELEALRESYRLGLPAKLDDLGARLRATREPGATRETLEEALRLAHTLKGSSGSYGFGELSAALQAVEDGLRELDPEERPDRARWADMERALARARTLF